MVDNIQMAKESVVFIIIYSIDPAIFATSASFCVEELR